MVSILDSGAEEKQIPYMWKLQILKSLEATLFSVILSGLTKCKCCFGEGQAPVQTWTGAVQLDPIIYFLEKCCPLKMAGDWSPGDLGCVHRHASDLLNALKFTSLFFCFPSCKRANTFPLLEGFETHQ